MTMIEPTVDPLPVVAIDDMLRLIGEAKAADKRNPIGYLTDQLLDMRGALSG